MNLVVDRQQTPHAAFRYRPITYVTTHGYTIEAELIAWTAEGLTVRKGEGDERRIYFLPWHRIAVVSVPDPDNPDEDDA